MSKEHKKDIEKKIVNLELNDILQSNDLDDINPNIALITILNTLIKNFEIKDIISKNMSKAYAIVSNTNQVQKDLINEIIAKQNDNKGKVKKMYFDIIKQTLNAVKQNNISEKLSLFDRIRNR